MPESAWQSVTAPKPAGTDWESWIDAAIAEGRDRGLFDDLAGTGEPIEGIGAPHDELWWVRKKLRDEELSYLPPTLAIRKEREDVLAALDTLSSETRVREALGELNDKIRAVNRRPSEGPPSSVGPVDVDHEVRQWKDRRDATSRTGPSPGDVGADGTGEEPRRHRWLGRGRSG